MVEKKKLLDAILMACHMIEIQDEAINVKCSGCVHTYTKEELKRIAQSLYDYLERKTNDYDYSFLKKKYTIYDIVRAIHELELALSYEEEN